MTDQQRANQLVAQLLLGVPSGFAVFIWNMLRAFGA